MVQIKRPVAFLLVVAAIAPVQVAALPLRTPQSQSAPVPLNHLRLLISFPHTPAHIPDPLDQSPPPTNRHFDDLLKKR